MSNNITTQECEIRKNLAYQYEDRIKIYINSLRENMTGYKYIGKDTDGLYLYDYIPHYNAGRNVFEIINETHHSYIKNSEYNTNIEKDILGLFTDGEIILISEGIERIEGLLVMNVEERNINKLFELLSEVQGVEIKPYDSFEIKDTDGYNLICGPYHLDEHFKRWSSNPKYNNGEECNNNERVLRGILTGEMKILKCKEAVVLTEDDIICLKYYLKNGYKYITNYQVYKKSISTDVNNPIYIYGDFINGERMFEPQDELSFVHHNHEDIWNIEELLEQERVNND